jgi:hypothetical protein
MISPGSFRSDVVKTGLRSIHDGNSPGMILSSVASASWSFGSYPIAFENPVSPHPNVITDHFLFQSFVSYDDYPLQNMDLTQCNLYAADDYGIDEVMREEVNILASGLKDPNV